MRAQYLVRIDDICPTMNWSAWKRIESILVQWGIKPLLAVIPDNQDDQLKVSPPDSSFWDQVRTWRDRGWTIGMHGYQHHYTTRDSGILGINRYSEFAGVSAEVQRAKLRSALEIFHREGVPPEVWIAPGHSFDHITVDLLRELGLRRISDGPFLFPRLDSKGMLWVPQQLWRFRPMPLGVWTVCTHINAWDSTDIARFERDIEKYRAYISSFPEVVGSYAGRRRNLLDSLFELSFPHLLGFRLRLRSWRTSTTSARHGSRETMSSI